MNLRKKKEYEYKYEYEYEYEYYYTSTIRLIRRQLKGNFIRFVLSC